MSRSILTLLALATLALAPRAAQATTCCEVHGYPGCDDSTIQACVCAQDSYCCETEWDSYCVNEVEEFGCGLCSAGSGDCCEANGSPGCSNYSVQACVCAQDAYCCETQWDSMCADEVEEFGCGSCGGGADYCPGYTGSSNCCTTDNPCDWANDNYCDCDGTCSWDANDCGGGGGDGDCCEDNGTPGCDDPGIQACVCAQDSYCCETQWDNICAQEVEEFGCGDCGGGADFCPGYTGSSDCCATDNPCDWADDGFCDCDGTCSWDSEDCGGGSFCGDGACDADETCATCPDDCGQCQGDGDCCMDNGTPGCDDAAIQACVCAQDAYCCDTQWDSVCADEVEELGCGVCGNEPEYCPGYTGTSNCCTTDNPCDWADDGWCDCNGTCGWDVGDCGGGSECGDGTCDDDETCDTCPEDCGPCQGDGDCCQDNGTPGCDDAGIQACVCAQDSFCCTNQWDNICAQEVEEFGCGVCSGGEVCPGYTGSSACCMTDDPCDWANDEFCDCDGTCSWDSEDCGGGAQCGDGWCEATEDCATCPEDCGQCQGDGDCCEENGTPGCADPAIQACVCAEDDYCCTTEWDEVCVQEVEELGCGECGAGAEFCPGYTGSSNCCKTDNPCDWANDGFCDCDSTCSWDSEDCGGQAAVCGDGACEGAETCQDCPEDCGPCQGDGDCCEANGTPGCADPAIQACVCAEDAYCCNTAWDGICAGEVESLGCGDCAAGPQCGDGTCAAGEDCETCPEDCGQCAGTGDCCTINETPGCDNPTIQACVCAVDSYCCTNEWDEICVDEVESEGCGSCSGGGCGDGLCEAPEDCLTCPEDCGACAGGSCCEPHEEPGCDDGTIEACVCAQDAFCCETQWDSICVNEVTSLGCGSCEGGPECGDGICQGGENCEVCPKDCGACPGVGDCCQPQETPGCNNPDIQACVCALDAFCCETMWDQICVDEVESEGCGSCDACLPDCAGKECGGDGCGGSCGTCAADQSCQNGKCVNNGCVPDCVGKQCGDDGCGGSCGDCTPGKTCENGKCVGGCTPDCTGLQCGDDGCGGTCGNCPPGFFCNDGHCQSQCEPDCVGKKCGPDGCGGTCGTCPPDFFCSADGHCEEQCQPNCAGKQCGSDGCGGTCGTCPGDQVCTNGHCTSDCIPNCTGKQCGSDGCGGSCGECPFGQYCTYDGHCDADCQPNCTNKECGDDGCGGSCGTCGFGQECSGGICTAGCVPDCLGKECGDNGCGGSCGVCGDDFFCDSNGICVACIPDCTDRECGDDGCGGSCGTCDTKDTCDEEQGICISPNDPAWPADAYSDAWADAHTVPAEQCVEGEHLVYGKCVPIEDDEAEDRDTSCTAGPTPNPSALLLLFALLGLIATRRARRGVKTER